MKRYLSVICLLFSCAVLPARADLHDDVETILQDKLLRRATVGVEVIRLGPSITASAELLNLKSHNPLIPASNLKVITTSAALDHFGPNFRFHTELLFHAGDLVVVGDGDPTLGDAEFLKKAGWDVTTLFENWAGQLKKLNLASVKDVVVDDSVFEDNFLHPHWPVNQVHKRYVAEVGGLNLNANCVDFLLSATAPGHLVDYVLDPPTHYVTVVNACRSGGENAVWLSREAGKNEIILRGEARGTYSVPVSVTIHDPPLFAATVLADTLATAGIKVTGSVRRDRTIRQQRQSEADARASKWVLLGIHETPITTVLARANKDSMNLYAECLCKRLGFETAHASGSWENGTAAVGGFLKHAGIAENEFTLDDGCGLSKQNTISPNAIATVLAYDFFSPNRDTFVGSLSVAGVDGTLDDRFAGTDLRRRVFGKSGFVEGVSTLSGYLKAKDEQWYAFSIMMNNVPPGGTAVAKSLQEKIVKSLDASTVMAARR